MATSTVNGVVFRASCPDCRASFELSCSELLLAIGRSRKTTSYSFTCPDCGAAVRKPAGERIVELLTAAKVRTMRLHPGPGTSLGTVAEAAAGWGGHPADSR